MCLKQTSHAKQDKITQTQFTLAPRIITYTYKRGKGESPPSGKVITRVKTSQDPGKYHELDKTLQRDGNEKKVHFSNILSEREKLHYFNYVLFNSKIFRAEKNKKLTHNNFRHNIQTLFRHPSNPQKIEREEKKIDP